MAKKYSIQTENDEIVSIEVDGAVYTDPDDIPDEQDRNKIKAMISRLEAAGSDEDLDQEFAAELAEMDRGSAVMPIVLLAVFLGIAGLTLATAAFSSYRALERMSREVAVPGQVIDFVVRPSRDSETGVVTDYTYPVVEYSPPGRGLLEVQLNEGSSPPEYSVGDPITVLYDPQQPKDARIKSFSSNLLLWILPGITLIVGASFATAAIVVIKVWPPWQKSNASP